MRIYYKLRSNRNLDPGSLLSQIELREMPGKALVFFSFFYGSLLYVLQVGAFTQNSDKREVFKMLGAVQQYRTRLCAHNRFEETYSHLIIKVVSYRNTVHEYVTGTVNK